MPRSIPFTKYDRLAVAIRTAAKRIHYGTITPDQFADMLISEGNKIKKEQEAIRWAEHQIRLELGA